MEWNGEEADTQQQILKPSGLEESFLTVDERSLALRLQCTTENTELILVPPPMKTHIGTEESVWNKQWVEILICQQ